MQKIVQICTALRDMELYGHHQKVYVINRKIYKRDSVVQVEIYLTPEGRMLIHDWLDIPYIIQNIPLIQNKIDESTNVQIPLREQWMQDIEMVSKYLDMKVILFFINSLRKVMSEICIHTHTHTPTHTHTCIYIYIFIIYIFTYIFTYCIYFFLLQCYNVAHYTDYLMDHPEIKQLIADYVQTLLVGNQLNHWIKFVPNLLRQMVLTFS